jgi:hypothetical protein
MSAGPRTSGSSGVQVGGVGPRAGAYTRQPELFLSLKLDKPTNMFRKDFCGALENRISPVLIFDPS